MGVQWTEAQAERVRDAMREFPVDSGRCVELARVVLPIAQQREEAAELRKLTAKGWYMPTHNGPSDWVFHVTTQAEAHWIDALTGVPGHPSATYKESLFMYPDTIQDRKIEPEDPWLSLVQQGY
jgi:hypothetical protein